MQRGKRAARAAALLLIASGVSGVSPSFFPRLDERWIFVAAVALIGAFGGIVIGILSAIAAVGCYELMLHSTLSFTPEKGGRTLGTKTFDITATSTVQDLLSFMQAAVGIQTAADDPTNPIPSSLNAIAGESGTRIWVG